MKPDRGESVSTSRSTNGHAPACLDVPVYSLPWGRARSNEVANA